jgi:hypothetical protein
MRAATVFSLMLCVLAAPALAQTTTEADKRTIDLKPLLPPVLPPLPRNSTLAPGATGAGSQSPYSDRLYDSSSSSSSSAPGLRFSIPTR